MSVFRSLNYELYVMGFITIKNGKVFFKVLTYSEEKHLFLVPWAASMTPVRIRRALTAEHN